MTNMNTYMSTGKILAAFAVFLMLVPAFAVAFSGSANAQVSKPGIIIKTDGSIEPPSAPIQRRGDTYVFTDDIRTDGISIQRAGITLDGAGHTLMGPYNGTKSEFRIGGGPDQTPPSEPYYMGIDFANNLVSGLAIKNLNIKNFSIAMYLWTPNNTVTGVSISKSIVGILLSGNDNTISDNYIADNENGVYFGSNEPGNIPTGVVLSGNQFVNNIDQLSGCVCVDFNVAETKHTWDNGSRGNYWSDYNGTDSNGDGIGDTPYVIDVLNEDRYPLMQGAANFPTPTPNINVVVAAAAAVSAIVAVVAVLVFRRRRQLRKVRG